MKKLKIITIALMIIYCLTAVAGYAKDDVRTLLEEARQLHKRGYNDAAIAKYNEILDKHPNNTEALLDYGRFMVDVRNYAYAVNLYRRYLKNKPGDENVWMLIIDIYASLGQSDEAAYTCLEYLKRDPDSKKFLTRLQKIYRKVKMSREEMLITEKLLKLKPDDNDVYKRLLSLYANNGRYKTAARLIDNKGVPEGFSKKRVGYIYLNAERYDDAAKIYNQLKEKNPTEENRRLYRRSILAKIGDRVVGRPGFLNSYYTPLQKLHREFPGDTRAKKLLHKMRKDVQRLHAGYEYTSGRTGQNDYHNHTEMLYYPVLSTGATLTAISSQFTIKNAANTAKYRQTGLDVRQEVGKNFILSGAYRDGVPGSTYYGQVYYQGDNFEAAVTGRKNYQLQTPEALQRNIYYRGYQVYGSWSMLERLGVYGRYIKYDYSDNNNARYRELGVYHRLWDNKRNSWLDVSVSNSWEDYDFTSPFYFSPDGLSQWNVYGEWNYYWTKKSLLRLSYTRSWDQLGNHSNFYSGYVDHKFSDNLFVYGEYLRGLSRAGRIGFVENPNNNDYEVNLGIKVKF